MSDAIRVWYISDLFEKISRDLKNQYQIETLSLHMNTVDNWFKRMEKEKIHFVHRDSFNRRIYNKTDLNIANYLYIETKINKESIGTIFKYGFINIKTRPYEEAADLTRYFGISPTSGESDISSILEPKKIVHSKSEDTIELREVLKKEVTFNSKKLTLNEKQRILDFLSGLVWTVNTPEH
ncbi:hypothetical protein [Ornithinibacillus contaminans]|uniref:hypothetical protein n=1 Tax=Ornithinibacillus contaminans TaxID=694055 RepID=UPI00064D760E|nr:hypothetical protein [Ornithinibacillus contaminans]